MLEITIDNCYKCDLETINDPNNSQYFWINRRDFEIETKRNWQVIFDKYKDLSTQKYKKELTPNFIFQLNKIFVRNVSFEEIIKICKATNLEFLTLKKNLYSMMLKIKIKIRKWETKNEKWETRNEKWETRNKKWESRNEKWEQTIKKKKKIKEEPEDMKSHNWIDKNKFKEILAIIGSNEFDYKNKIDEFKYIKIKDLVNNIKNNAISETDAKKDLNALNKIIKYKKRTPKHKILLNLFNDLSDNFNWQNIRIRKSRK